MTDIFYRKSNYNQFDNLYVDVNKLYEEFPITDKINGKSGIPSFARTKFHKIYRSSLLPLRRRTALCEFLRRVNVDLSWFQEFSSYWTRVLHGRPMWGVQDFYFLRGLYRVKFSANQVPDTDDPGTQLSAWQRPEIIYQLFHQVYKEAIRSEIATLELLFKYKKDVSRFLEFGCANAPITTSLFDFFPSARSFNIYISDIKTLAFHYGGYRFRNCSNVHPILLSPENGFLPVSPEPVDAIFCMAVFEHLNQPLNVVKAFYEMLEHGGILIFDYIRGEGAGLDTKQGVLQREYVLDYVSHKFNILFGSLEKDESMGITVVQKK